MSSTHITNEPARQRVTRSAKPLSSKAVMASAPHGSPNGFGESDLGATLNLAIPASAPAGPYSSNLTITAVTTN